MFTLRKNELARFHDAIKLIEQHPETKNWSYHDAQDRRFGKTAGTRARAIEWATNESKYGIVIEQTAPNVFRPVVINIRAEYHLGAAEAAAAVRNAYTVNPTDDYLALNKAVSWLNESMEIDREDANPKITLRPRPPLAISAWTTRLSQVDKKKLYRFSGDFTMNDLQKLTIRPGIIKKNSNGIYLYREAGEKNYMKSTEWRECLERLVFNGCPLVAEKQKNGKYKIIYNDLENTYHRGYLAVTTLVKAIYQLPVPPEQKKKMIFKQVNSFLAMERKKLGQKFRLENYL